MQRAQGIAPHHGALSGAGVHQGAAGEDGANGVEARIHVAEAGERIATTSTGEMPLSRIRRANSHAGVKQRSRSATPYPWPWITAMRSRAASRWVAIAAGSRSALGGGARVKWPKRSRPLTRLAMSGPLRLRTSGRM